jgi:hypothetical protein
MLSVQGIEIRYFNTQSSSFAYWLAWQLNYLVATFLVYHFLFSPVSNHRSKSGYLVKQFLQV